MKRTVLAASVLIWAATPTQGQMLSANAEGRFQKSQYDAYSVTNLTGQKNPDGSVAVQFGDCDGKIPNCLPTVAGWNYMVRFYRPLREILEGKWKFPEAQAVN
jgi:hypothetical protein